MLEPGGKDPARLSQVRTTGIRTSQMMRGTRTAGGGRRRSIEKAMRRNQGGGGIFDGSDALDEVSKADGNWNWALVGPDAEGLPLAGGGMNNLEGIANAMTQHPHCFGLMRMSFTQGAAANKTFYIFLHATDTEHIKKFPMRERGTAMMVEPKMEQVFKSYAPYSAKVDLSSQEECNVEFIVQALKSDLRGPDADIANVDNCISFKVQDSGQRRGSVTKEAQGQAEKPKVDNDEDDVESCLTDASEASAEAETAEKTDEQPVESKAEHAEEEKTDRSAEELTEGVEEGKAENAEARKEPSAEQVDEQEPKPAEEQVVELAKEPSIGKVEVQESSKEEQAIASAEEQKTEPAEEQKRELVEEQPVDKVEEQQVGIAEGQKVDNDEEQQVGKVEEQPAVVAEEQAPEQVDEQKVEESLEEQKEEQQKVEEQAVEEQKVEEQKVEEQKAEEPKIEEPKAEEPKVEEPKVEEPKVEVPKVEEPKVEEPKAEEPKAEEPKAEEPKAEEPKVEEPKVEEPKAEEPKVEEQKAEEQKTEGPKAPQKVFRRASQEQIDAADDEILEVHPQMEMPRPQVAQPAPDMHPYEATGRVMPSQRRTVRLYAQGDVVEIYSEKDQAWMLDGEVEEVTNESSHRDGFNIRAGSMKVTYCNGMRFKWIAPQQMEQYLRPSPRPRPPDPMVGELYKETHSWFRTWWQPCYCELNKGFLMWWETVEVARTGSKPTGSLYLLGLDMKVETKPDKAGVTTCLIKMRSTSSQGAIFVFKREDGGDLESWKEAFWAHAGFCEEAREFYQAREGGQEMRKELLQVLARRTSKTRKSVTSTTGTSAVGHNALLLPGGFLDGAPPT